MAYRWIKVEDDPSYYQIIAKAEKLLIFKNNIDAVDKKKLMRKAFSTCMSSKTFFIRGSYILFCFISKLFGIIAI